MEQVSYLGVRVDYELRAGEQRLYESLDSREVRRTGETIRISVKGDAVWLIEDEPDLEPFVPEDEKKGLARILSMVKKKGKE